MKKIFSILLMMLMLSGLVMAGTVSRTFSDTTIATSENLDITYTTTGGGTYIKQEIPAGWSVVDNAGGTITNDVLRFSLSGTDIVTLQTSSSGTTVFAGQYIVDGSDWLDFSETSITVGGVVECTPSWTCGSWDECTNDEQDRSCNDGCGNSKTESQSCTMDVVGECMFYEELVDGECVIPDWVYIVGVVAGLVLVLALVK